MFNKGAGNQALVQYPDVASAQTAYEQVRKIETWRLGGSVIGK